jgi:predicted O-linked N-acetylglucosamine transferase (SPINDLY family)
MHFGSGISFYESIWTGTPIVTMEGPFLRSRYAAGGYRLMGLGSELVASGPDQMADLASALLRDGPRRETLRHRIKEAARLHLYDRMDVVHSFEAFAEEAIARARHSTSG